MVRGVRVWAALLAGAAGSISLLAADYDLPMKIPVSLSANFGEPRPNHFHSGIDFRTQKKEGIPVYAIADGYVSRIGILWWGYGNALYLTHRDGVTSVYAHLQRFAPAIAEWAKEQQYANQAFVLDVHLDTRKFPVKKGDLIGYSGNSGHSMGPHLHFELRDRSQSPFNPLSRGIYRAADNIPPHAERLYVYRLDNIEQTLVRSPYKTYPLARSGSTFRPAHADTIEVTDNAIFGLDMTDHKNNSQSAFGVYSVQVLYDDSLCLEWSIDHFSFANTRYVNALMDYYAYARSRRYVTMLYCAPNNALRIFGGTGSGVMRLSPYAAAKVEIRMTDDAGNTSRVLFWAKNTAAYPPPSLPAYSRMLYYNKSNSVLYENFKVMIPKSCLYESCPMTMEYDYVRASSALTPLYSLSCAPSTPLHCNMVVGIRADIPPRFWEKVAMVNQGGTGKKAVREGDFWLCSTRDWGTFQLAIDTLPPQIKYISPRSDKSRKPHLVRFRITDNMTSVKKYNGYIDGKWALFEYDNRCKCAVYRIDYTRVSRNVWLCRRRRDGQRRRAYLRNIFLKP